tara:strand:- start:116 stop:520 length:405 start_codon:yes stop_codon:yes gene_type:complete
MLGVREPDIYGCETLADIEELCNQRATSLGLTVNFKQSNLEGEIVADIQNARGTAAGIIINAAGYTHTSVAILDALNISELPVIELHISNIHAREAFRHHSYVAQAATGIICGFGAHGYVLAIDAMARLIECAE